MTRRVVPPSRTCVAKLWPRVVGCNGLADAGGLGGALHDALDGPRGEVTARTAAAKKPPISGERVQVEAGGLCGSPREKGMPTLETGPAYCHWRREPGFALSVPTPAQSNLNM